ncbi:MAG: KpsF/GutQ family sugar-phosphate isomerase [Desulfobacterales bacterium]
MVIQNTLEMIKQEAKEVLKIEAEGILSLIDRIDSRFIETVELLYHCKGRVIVGGIGKSGIVGRKIVATLNSTGTRAVFLHPVEAMHGDLGIVSQDDVFLALSNSGETDELNILVPSIRQIGCKVIAFTGNSRSTLAESSDIVIDVGVVREACPMGLAPTASTTALLAMGDALAVVLLKKRHFNSFDFQRIHPGGTLGHRLSSCVRDIMLVGKHIPMVRLGTSMESAIFEMDRPNLGVTFVVDEHFRLCGIITDGDIRRLIAQKKTVDNFSVDELMTRTPLSIGPDAPTYDALNLMEQFQITVLPIIEKDSKVVGILHLHDILGKGEFKFNGR